MAQNCRGKPDERMPAPSAKQEQANGHDVRKEGRKRALSPLVTKSRKAAYTGSPLSGQWLRGVDLNHRPLGYEPNELPGCSTPRQEGARYLRAAERSSRGATKKSPLTPTLSRRERELQAWPRAFDLWVMSPTS